MPRTEGVSSSSRVLCILFRPRPISVARWSAFADILKFVFQSEPGDVDAVGDLGGVPAQVLDLRQPTTPRTIGESLPESPPRYREDRETSYRTRRRSFANGVRAELAALEKEVDAFSLGFQTGDGRTLSSPGHEEFEAIEVEDVNQEKIVKSKR